MSGVTNGSIKFEMMRNMIDETWFIGCTWEDLQQKHQQRSCWNRLTLEELPAWIRQITVEIDAGRLKGNDA